jgi:hypothetical protein
MKGEAKVRYGRVRGCNSEPIFSAPELSPLPITGLSYQLHLQFIKQEQKCQQILSSIER